MAKLVQQSTANDPLFFFLVLSSDHISPATGLAGTVAVTISKNGAAFATPAGAITEIANGWYQVAGNATDTNTLGDILLHAAVATADNCDLVAAQVVSFNPRNANLGLTNVSANVAQWNGTNVAVPATAGIPDINVKNYNNVAATTDANNLPKVDVEDWHATAVSVPATAGIPDINVKNWNNVVVGNLPANFSTLSIDGSGNVSITSNVKKNAGGRVTFVMTDSTNHLPAAGLTITSTRSLDGAAFVATTNTATGISNGVYTLVLSAADTNGNDIDYRFTATGADDLNIEYVTQP